jgi:hypothetical protein
LTAFAAPQQANAIRASNSTEARALALLFGEQATLIPPRPFTISSSNGSHYFGPCCYEEMT